MPSIITSRVKPTARNSGAIRMRPAESISTSEALPRKMRCQARADIGHAAICSRWLPKQVAEKAGGNRADAWSASRAFTLDRQRVAMLGGY
jgi:hypothetical protein